MVRLDETSTELEFQISSRQTIVQELPIQNTSDDDWLIRAQLQGVNFSCPASFVAKAQSKSFFPLKYHSPVTAENQGSLVLTNNNTNQRFSYRLFGHATDPLAEGNEMIECAVGLKVQFC